ncbi:glutamate--tRNA ligase [Caldilinea sp.]|jgi:glutamyl-tRNA synthetase|uniref:glutamate--tRNA ligase n=1 Tax=Caldilinea sp. TaxID=2293560 RepID=UPI0021DDB036|nr:glutamate--tRNA ligase [Caldilinea sp.]GIV71134.1 MAG: glutamate--tRNA ligase [Caldilinea sp.]
MTKSSQTPARVRFAPSPTGYLHLGGLRTALFDWLYARHTGGQFILRIEDTDQKRYNPESLQDLMEGLRWLGLHWDEGPDIGGPHAPYIQSQRQPIYQQYANWLVEHGKAYRCYTTEEELEELRARGLPYDRRHRNLTPEQRAAFEAEGRPFVIRFAAPLTGTTTVHDAIRGEITVENATIVDPVLLKSDGLPTYHLAVVVDDHLMEITHVLRGEEWIPSAPLHVLLFEAFGWSAPVFVHLPVILDPSGKGKMSKRKTVVDGREFSPFVRDYIRGGYLPDAMFNFLATMGWSFDPEREIFTREEAIERFDVADISPKATALPFSKLEWMNGVYIRQMDVVALKDAVAPFVAADLGLDVETLRRDPRLLALTPLIQERIKLLTEATALVDWAFLPAEKITYPDPTQLIGKKLTAAQSIEALEAARELIATVEPFEAATLEAAFRSRAEAMDIKLGSFLTPVRVAVTGKTVSPPLFESIHILGREETLKRLVNAIQALTAYAATAVERP